MAAKSFREDIRRKIHEGIIKKQEAVFIAPPTPNLPPTITFNAENAAAKAVIEKSNQKTHNKPIR